MQIVNTRLAVYTKDGGAHSKTGEVLYGPVATSTLWAGFGGVCEARNNGDGVVRYDQLAGRWLFVMPIITRTNPGDYPEGHGDAVHAGPSFCSGCARNFTLESSTTSREPYRRQACILRPESEQATRYFCDVLRRKCE